MHYKREGDVSECCRSGKALSNMELLSLAPTPESGRYSVVQAAFGLPF